MKITGIELLQKVKDNEFSIYQKATSLDSTYRDCTIEFILDTSNLDEIMNLEFEVQTTEKTKENKEIKEVENISYNFTKTSYTGIELSKNFETITELLNKQSDKINELARAVNKLIKESEEN